VKETAGKEILIGSAQGIEHALTGRLADEISHLIESAKARVASTVNSSLVVLNWNIGKCLIENVKGDAERAEYGEKIVVALAEKLTPIYGRGFTARSLFRMIQFCRVYDDFEIVTTLSAQLSWSHFIELMGIENPLSRQFYTEMCRLECWSVRMLRSKIQSRLFERTAISKSPEAVISAELDNLGKNKITPALVFRDPYFLDFLNLPQNYNESDLENAILSELSNFIQEFGNDFCFLARQKRMIIGGEDFYLDLLFFHRSLRRLIAIELKLDKFSAAHKGQMELYLRWLNKYERKEHEDPPLGLILCARKNQEQIELLEMDQSQIHVAQYLTELPPMELLEKKLHEAIIVAREKLARHALLYLEGDQKDQK
jgi:predicted nuclease of restriction endonuclease-like (RecB) superfamily